MRWSAKWWLFYPVCVAALFIMVFEVPFKEIRRAWRNMKIWNRYKDNWRIFKSEWRKGPYAG